MGLHFVYGCTVQTLLIWSMLLFISLLSILEKNQFFCPLCPRSCPTHHHLKEHIKNCHNGRYGALVNVTENDREHTTPSGGSKTDGIICSDCGKSFRSLSHLKIHHVIHTGEKPYECSECGKSFNRPDNLKAHRRVHTGERPHPCSECERSFNRRSHLRTHQRIHAGEEQSHPSTLTVSESKEQSKLKEDSVCSDCGKRLSSPGALKVHRRIHTGEKPFRCSQCGRGFVSQSDLIKHRRIHSGEKPFQCSECGKCFNNPSSLKRHQRIHSGEKPHQCAQCKKSFIQQSHLRIHQRSHSGEKPYFCSHCRTSFTYLSRFKKHNCDVKSVNGVKQSDATTALLPQSPSKQQVLPVTSVSLVKMYQQALGKLKSVTGEWTRDSTLLIICYLMIKTSSGNKTSTTAKQH